MAAKKPSGLGRGLGALLGDDVMKTEGSGQLYLPISQVESNSSQPRKYFDEEALAELADSIREHGIIQPLTVRKLTSGYYQIIAGERRWRAARIAGLAEVPAIVIEADDRKAAELAMIENLQREDLNPMEEAAGFHSLMENYHMTQEEAAQRVGKSRSAVANALRLLNLTEPVRAMVEDGRLSAGHARALLVQLVLKVLNGLFQLLALIVGTVQGVLQLDDLFLMVLDGLHGAEGVLQLSDALGGGALVHGHGEGHQQKRGDKQHQNVLDNGLSVVGSLLFSLLGGFFLVHGVSFLLVRMRARASNRSFRSSMP